MAEYREILSEELVHALGCTEPIAIALCAAQARKTLGAEPESLTVHCSGNVIKNARCVIVPGTDGMAGIEASAAVGALGGDPEAGLQTLTGLQQAHVTQAQAFIAQGRVRVQHEKNCPLLYIRVTARAGQDEAEATVSGAHNHIARLSKNGAVLLDAPSEHQEAEGSADAMRFDGILRYATQVDLGADPQLVDLLNAQIACNADIAEEGLRGDYGASVGKTLMESYPADLKTRLRAYAAAGSDARMAGSPMPVVINSGSGNQGLTSSLPLIVYARENNLPQETLHRALIMANLLAVYIKRMIGKLSAFCGVVSAAAASGAALAWLEGLSDQQMGEVISTTLLTSGGIFCDGAKASCASKIAVSLDNALMALEMARRGRGLPEGQGLAGADIEDTIRKVARVAREGMRDTDDLILRCMLDKPSQG